MTWGWVGTRGTWDTAEAAASMAAMADHAVTWTALAYAAVQATPFSTDIPFQEEPTVTDEEIVAAIRRAARIGEAEGCAMLCIGCEMVRADGQEAHWRRLIDDVRSVYSGLVTYN